LTADIVWCALRHKQASPAEVGFLCAHHAAAVNETLQDILEFWTLLPLYLIPDEQGHDSGSKRGKVSAAPAPLRVDVLALTDGRNHNVRDPGRQPWWAPVDVPDVAGLLSTWAQLAVYGHTEHVPRLTVHAAVRVLQAHRARTAALDAVGDYWTELRNIRSMLAAASGEPNRKPVGHCPTLDGNGDPCDGPLWADRQGSMQVTCGKCDRVFDEPMLRHLGGMLTA
jgi:hypothetical protein